MIPMVLESPYEYFFEVSTTTYPCLIDKEQSVFYSVKIFSPLASLPQKRNIQLELLRCWQLASFIFWKNHRVNQSDLFKRGKPALNGTIQAYLLSQDFVDLDLIEYNGNTTVSYPASSPGSMHDNQSTEVALRVFITDDSARLPCDGIKSKFVNGINKWAKCLSSRYEFLAAWNFPQESNSWLGLDEQGAINRSYDRKEQINWVTTSVLVGGGSDVTAAR